MCAGICNLFNGSNIFFFLFVKIGSTVFSVTTMLLYLKTIVLFSKTGVTNKRVIPLKYVIVSLLFLLLLQVPGNIFGQNKSPKFIRLTTNEGLSQGHINAILKGSRGFMWFATNGGLNKYDGYKFLAYKHDQDKPESISNNIVSDLLEDTTGSIWVATRSGLDKFNRSRDKFSHYHPGKGSVNDIFLDSRKRIWAATSDGLYLLNEQTGAFTTYKHNTRDANSLSDNFVSKITEDNTGDLWIGTKNGLNRLNVAQQRFSSYKNNPANSASIGSDWVRTVYKDSKGNIWAGTLGGGISRFNPEKNSFVTYRHNVHNSNSLSLNDILSFCEDEKGRLWIGTENGGVSVFDQAGNTFTTYKNDPYNVNSLSNNSIYSIYEDDLHNMWVGTYSEGVNFLPKEGDKFVHYSQNLANSNSLNDHNVLAIEGDENGIIWIGTDGGGLNRLDQKNQKFTYYQNDINNTNSINSNYVISVIAIDDDLLCLGLLRGGLDVFNTKTGRFTHHLPEKGNAKSVSSSTVTILKKSYDGNVWVGTWGAGLDYYDRKNNTFKHYVSNPNDTGSISSNFISCILEDRQGNLWVGSDNGLDRLNKATNTFIHYQHSDNDKKSISQNLVQYIFQDHSGNLWIGTNGGLNLYNSKSGTFTAYTEKDGLANNMIQSIREDRIGRLWLASNGGLTKFNPVTKTCRNYNPSDGLQGKEFKPSSCFQAKDGQMFFGGTNGFNAFYPGDLKDNRNVPIVYITDFQIFNTPVAPGGKGSALRQQISEAKEITLSYKQSVFSFEFSALNYTLPSKNQYAYKLEGFDKDWIYSGSKRTATYTNLDPGTYIFRVRGSNNDGFWNEKGASVTIYILPPFWMTWWFRMFVFMVILGGAATLYISRISIINGQKKILEQKVHEQTAQLKTSNEEERKARNEADEANKAKSVFLATMSHEIRTPMNGVIGMAALLMQTGLNSEQKSYAKTITTCGESLLSVINSILDFSKIESGKMELENKLFNLKTCIDEVLEVFSFNAKETGIKLSYHIAANVPLQITGDSLRLRQVLLNLVANAMKFTPAGEVFIGVKMIDTPVNGSPIKINFQVRDTGIGIPAAKLERLFKAFTQVDSSTTRKHGGTGLGLVICEKLVNLMNGSITVESEFGKGTTFTFDIETSAAKAVENKSDGMAVIHTEVTNKLTEGQKLTTDFSAHYPLRILVAEDNAVNIVIINKILGKLGYQPKTVENGLEVLEALTRQNFDVVLMDVQMPEMDGLEATKAIRETNRTQPVIIAMTANAMQGDKDDCLAAGMDDYLSKPINLDAMINMLKKWGEQVKINRGSKSTELHL